MKRVFLVALVLCLLPVFSVAEDYEFVRYYIDEILKTYDCKAFPEEYKSTYNENGLEYRHFFMTDNVKISIATNGEVVDSVGASCFDESELHDFLVSCYACLTAFGVSPSSAANNVFFSYLNAKIGESQSNLFGNDVISRMYYYPEKDSFTYVVMKVVDE